MRHHDICAAAAAWLMLAAPALAQTGGQAAAAKPSAAKPAVVLDIVTEAVRTTTDANGQSVTRYEPPALIVPGDMLRFTLGYRNTGKAPATDFVITNPVPAQVRYAGAEPHPGLELSVDGGRSWGQLAALSIAAADGTRRPATADDVTHVRWKLAQPIRPGEGGQVRYSASVR